MRIFFHSDFTCNQIWQNWTNPPKSKFQVSKLKMTDCWFHEKSGRKKILSFLHCEPPHHLIIASIMRISICFYQNGKYGFSFYNLCNVEYVHIIFLQIHTVEITEFSSQNVFTEVKIIHFKTAPQFFRESTNSLFTLCGNFIYFCFHFLKEHPMCQICTNLFNMIYTQLWVMKLSK